jgi:hypothetical protein
MQLRAIIPESEALSGIVTDRSAYLFCDPASRFARAGMTIRWPD